MLIKELVISTPFQTGEKCLGKEPRNSLPPHPLLVHRLRVNTIRRVVPFPGGKWSGMFFEPLTSMSVKERQLVRPPITGHVQKYLLSYIFLRN